MNQTISLVAHVQHPPSKDDVLQGRLNNCYLVCALGLLAEVSPDSIVRCFEHDKANGTKKRQRGRRTFDVSLYRGRDRTMRKPDREDIEHAFERVIVRVDNQVQFGINLVLTLFLVQFGINLHLTLFLVLNLMFSLVALA